MVDLRGSSWQRERLISHHGCCTTEGWSTVAAPSPSSRHHDRSYLASGVDGGCYAWVGNREDVAVAAARGSGGRGGGSCARVARTRRRRMRVGVRWRRRRRMRPLGRVAALTRASARAAGMRDDWLGAA